MKYSQVLKLYFNMDLVLPPDLDARCFPPFHYRCPTRHRLLLPSPRDLRRGNFMREIIYVILDLGPFTQLPEPKSGDSIVTMIPPGVVNQLVVNPE